MRRDPDRREVVAGGLAALLGGCSAETPLDTGGPAPPGEFLGLVPFVDEEPRALDVLTGTGLDGRLVTDLSAIDEILVTPNDRFYVRTAASTLLDTSGWSVAIAGRVAEPVALDLGALRDLAAPQGVLQFECSGNSAFGGFGLMSAASWDGVLLADLLALVDPEPGADLVRVTGFDTYPDGSETSVPGAAWVFPRAELEAAGAFLATAMNGADLPRDHGAPVRLVVPGWYGCTNIKWVQEIALVGADEPATSQMIEFAERTHQDGEPALAVDYVPAVIDVAAVAVRVERWRIETGAVALRIIGVTWGGPIPANVLRLHIDGDAGREVEVSPPRTDGRTWGRWEHWWEPTAAGEVALSLSVDDPTVRTRRLDTGYYTRSILVDPTM